MNAEVRVVSINVHGWRDRWRRSNTRRVAAFLRPLRPHVLCLQEVQARSRWSADDFVAGEEDPKSTDLAFFQSLLALPVEGEREEAWKWEWEWLSLADWGGSLVASRLPVTRHFVHRLTSGGAEARPLVGMRVAMGELGVVDVFCAHLDHLMESNRTSQVEALLGYLDESGSGPHRALLGDFNALSREDYSDEEWARIGVRREAARLEQPSSQATDLLRRRGYTDVRPVIDREEEDDEEDDGEEEEEEEEEVHMEEWTCWAGTRVDYAWVSGALERAANPRLGVVPDLTLSDHRPLILSLRPTTSTP